MPLKLLEQVLPWFVEKLNDAESSSFIRNMQLAGLSLFTFYFPCMYNLLVL
jgi:zinc finger protein-like protein